MHPSPFFVLSSYCPICRRKSFVVSVPVLASSLALVVVCISPSMFFQPLFQCLPQHVVFVDPKLPPNRNLLLVCFSQISRISNPSFEFRVPSFAVLAFPRFVSALQTSKLFDYVSIKVSIFVFACLLPCIKSPKTSKTIVDCSLQYFYLSLLRSYYLDTLPCLCPRDACVCYALTIWICCHASVPGAIYVAEYRLCQCCKSFLFEFSPPRFPCIKSPKHQNLLSIVPCSIST